ncbi:GRB2-related adapter protein 2b [Anoplopoma fimbria]|uniref:GRB2-related adapter protein 2b n=1 Tax=Anoplopoma fimbria TaxID=229290 RepID=UPI0023EBBB2A|nr:GRB2-related adapter protein 2b [Anoplopoma fimbria]
MEATAKYDYEAKAGDELSFRKGDLLVVLPTTGNWYTAGLTGREGVVPKNFINIHLPSWYQEDFSRDDAREKLIQQPQGAFLIRGSQKSVKGDFSVTVRHAADVKHFKVLRDSRGQYYIWTEKFPSLNQLVEYYKHNSISKETKIFLKETRQQQRQGSENVPLPTAPPLFSPTPAPGQQQASSGLQVKALYSFNAEEKDELQFNAGDVIKVLECSDETWWRGQLRGQIGLFPCNYTQPI